MKPKPWTILVVVGALLGAVFALVSTSDFAAHLDRQVHGIHCSFLPGVGTPDVSGTSGCHVTLMSPYSSVLRQSVWGGIPISLPAIPVFGFIAFFAVALWLLRWQSDVRATGLLLAASALPFGTSVVMAAISFFTLGAACKLCIGIYVASIVVFAGAALLFFGARKNQTPRFGPQMGGTSVRANRNVAEPSPPVPYLALAAAAVFGACAVLVPTLVYAAATPEHREYVGTCGTLDQPNPPAGVLIPLGAQAPSVRAIEILDPLCPACRGFEERLGASGHDERIARQAVLFPLDSSCNWMVDEAIHPGACTVSEAMLCAGNRAEEVLAWAFEEQTEIREAAADNPDAAKQMVTARFPDLARCVGSPNARAKLNRSLQWAVANELPVLTPQLYVNDVRVCDADTDLGLDYTLDVLLERAEAGTLVPTPAAEGEQ